MKQTALKDMIGKRGENIVELCMTEYSNFPAPLFTLTHLGDKWPVIDYCVERTTVPGKRPFFFLQAKATAATNPKKSLAISTSREDIAGLLEIPAPTCILGLHEPSKRVFILRSILGRRKSNNPHTHSIRINSEESENPS